MDFRNALPADLTGLRVNNACVPDEFCNSLPVAIGDFIIDTEQLKIQRSLRINGPELKTFLMLPDQIRHGIL